MKLSSKNTKAVLHRGIAEQMGAQALEAWAWVERGQQAIRLSSERGKWEGAAHGLVIGYGPTPLAAVLAAMEKEKG